MDTPPANPVGGSNAFATRHLSRFARFEEYDGRVRIEVPTAMVALVSTAFYAALSEWRSGKSKHIDFSANTYHEVYINHLGTMASIANARNGRSFHAMMADIYERASCSEMTSEPAVNIAMINIEEMED
ncbi:hypothetical protein BGW80DRAFT_1457249 [Lactifluus volemus]|nr:hypothetical protein BGW80DRAFT_1457249 [Lactifluus volemus]